MLNALADNYVNLPNVGFGNDYNELVTEAVRILQRLYGLTDNGIVDREIWNIIVTLFSTRASLRNTPWSDPL